VFFLSVAQKGRCSFFVKETRDVSQLRLLGVESIAQISADGIPSDIWGTFTLGTKTYWSVGYWEKGGYIVKNVGGEVDWSGPTSTIEETIDITASVVTNTMSATEITIESVPWATYKPFSEDVQYLLRLSGNEETCQWTPTAGESLLVPSKHVSAGKCRTTFARFSSGNFIAVNPSSLAGSCFRQGQSGHTFSVQEKSIPGVCNNTKLESIPRTYNESVLKTLLLDEFPVSERQVPVILMFEDGASLRSTYAPGFYAQKDFSDMWGALIISELPGTTALPQYQLCFRRIGDTTVNTMLLPDIFYCVQDGSSAFSVWKDNYKKTGCTQSPSQISATPCIDNMRLSKKTASSEQKTGVTSYCQRTKVEKAGCTIDVSSTLESSQTNGFFRVYGNPLFFSRDYPWATNFTSKIGEKPDEVYSPKKRMHQVNGKIFEIGYLCAYAAWIVFFVFVLSKRM